jgi:hypothetical protein
MNETMQEYLDRCERAIAELEKLVRLHNYESAYAEQKRLLGKIEGVKLARDYAKEMFKDFLEAS